MSETSLELSVLDLFEEWLKGYFNGAAHAIGVNSNVSFPSVELRFQQDGVSQPLNGTAISTVWESPARIGRCWDKVAGERQQMAYVRTSFTFWVRTAMKSVTNQNARRQCAQVASLLFAILQNSNAARPLSQKGIHRLRPSPPRAVASADFQLRMVMCEGTLRYPILSQV